MTRALYRDKQDVVGQIVEAVQGPGAGPGQGSGLGSGPGSGQGLGAGVGARVGSGSGVGSEMGGVRLMDGSTEMDAVPSHLPSTSSQAQLLSGDVYHLQVTPLRSIPIY